MKFISLDIETTAIRPQDGVILTLAMAAFDTSGEKPLEPVEQIAFVVDNGSVIRGTLNTLAFNADLLTRINAWHKGDTTALPHYHEYSVSVAKAFFIQHASSEGTVVLAGKNIDSFDIPWIREHLSGLLPADSDTVRKLRTLDPTAMFALPLDDRPPRLEKCCMRAGVKYDDELAHDACYDAVVAGKCVVVGLLRNWEGDEALALLSEAVRFVEQDAQMAADLTRHAPLPPDAQAAHDSTETESEILLAKIESFLGGSPQTKDHA